jgi:hypothetical protein
MKARCTLAVVAAVGLTNAALSTTAHADPNSVTVVAGPRASLAHRLAKELEASGVVVHVEDTQPTDDAALFVVVPEDATAPIEIWTTKDGVSSLLATVASDGPADTRVLRAAEIARALAGRSEGAAPAAPPANAPHDEQTAAGDANLPDPSGGPGPASNDAAPKRRPKKPPRRPSDAEPRPPSDDDGGTPWPTADAVSHETAPTSPALFDFGLAVGLGAQSQGASLQIEGGARVWPADRVGIGLFASAPAAGANIETSVGRATLRSSLFGIELSTAPVVRTSTFGVILSPGVGIDWVHVEGEAKTPYSSDIGDGVQAALYGRGELRIRLTGPLRLSLGAMGGAALPAVDITFNGKTQSTFCPFGSASLGAVVEP